MEKSEHSSVDNRFLKTQYDQRYDGDYMDGDAYSSWVHEGLAAHRVRQTLQQIPGRPSSILDYGCGQGKWTPLLHALFPEAQITGIDISEVAAQKAARKYPDFRFLGFDGTRAPVDDAEFDLVFSFHVLEHVLDVAATVHDIARSLRPGGYACIIFPCGNRQSFEERFVRLLKNGREPSSTGETIFFFEKEEGHLRRLESAQTIAIFRKEGLVLQQEFYSGQFFATLDWLVRGTGPHYINGMFRNALPANRAAAIRLALLQRLLLGMNRFLTYRNIDLTKRRPLLKRLAVRLASGGASMLDNGIMKLAQREWDRHRDNKSGSVQYLIFKKTT